MPHPPILSHPFHPPAITSTPRTKKVKRIMPQPVKSPSPVDMHVYYSQVFKSKDEAYDNEVISSLNFNRKGNLIAAGDKGGNIHVFKRDKFSRSLKYKRYLSFQSHMPEFDYLKSIEIEEKIAQIQWLRTSGPADLLLASNDRTIKLWRVGESRKHEYGSQNVTSGKQLTIPRPVSTTSIPSSRLCKSFKNGHAFHINTISVNSDEQTFASSDDLRINLWSTERTDISFVLVDMKPDNMENLHEVITSCTFHPTQCNILAYATSRGSTKLCDLRTSVTCDNPSRHYRDESKTPGYQGFFAEVVNSLSDAQFSNCGTRIATRDFMTVRIWDTRMESSALSTIPVHEFLRPHLHLLYENDLIFDKFSVSWNHNDSSILTGSYHDMFMLIEPNSEHKSTFKSSLFRVPDESPEIILPLKPKRVVQKGDRSEDKHHDTIKIEDMELSRRTLVSQWHPTEKALAVATCNQVSIFT